MKEICLQMDGAGGHGGKGKIRVLVSKFYDADGYILEVNQILSD